MSKSSKKTFAYRSAKTGRYVKQGYAKRYPDITVKEDTTKKK